MTNPADEKVATKADWKCKPLPKRRTLLDFHRTVPADMFGRIKYGHVPLSMDDHWFSYFEEPWLYLHRSWTGYCIYALRFEQSSGGHRVAETWVNREARQYEGKDSVSDVSTLRELLDSHFGMKDYEFYRQVLRMVSELHVRGLQCLRIAPGMSPGDCFWQCAITPVTNISSQHGARMVSRDTLVAHFSTKSESGVFGCAKLFIERFPEIAEAGRGSDWLYAGWYLEMLHLTYPDALPIAYADRKLPKDYMATTGGNSDVRIPLPPPGLCKD